MRIKSLLLCNACFKIGDQRVVLPANPTILELDDKKFAAFIPRFKKLVGEKAAEWVKTPAVSKEAQAELDAAELKAAKALIAASEAPKVTKTKESE